MLQDLDFSTITLNDFYLNPTYFSAKAIYSSSFLFHALDKNRSANEEDKIQEDELKAMCLIGIASHGRIETLNTLFRNGIDLSLKDKNGTNLGTAAIISSVRWNDKESWPEIFSKLLEQGVDINSSDYMGRNVTMVATYCNLPKKLQTILENGGNPNLHDKQNRTALGYLVRDSKEIAELIINSNTNINSLNLFNQNVIDGLKRRNFNNTLNEVKNHFNQFN